MIAAAALLVVAAVAFAEATGTPAYQLLVAIVGVPLFLLWWARTLIRTGEPAATLSQPAPPVRSQIVITRPAEPDYYAPALPYGEVAVRALPTPRLSVLHGGRDEAAS
jgi:hypothetical protein